MKMLFVTLLAAASASAQADPAEALAKAKSCYACHTMDKKLVGPGFKEVAARYRNDKSSEDRLVLKILKGGAGTWGAVPMPPNDITDAEAHLLVRWILAQ